MARLSTRPFERFLRIRAELGGLRPFVTLAFVVQPGNAHEARDFRDHWKGILEELGREVAQSWDWPSREVDTIYLRPLNCGEQEESDALHARVCRELGIAPPGSQDRLRAAESF